MKTGVTETLRGIKQQRGRNPQTAANDPACHPNLLTALFEATDARRTHREVHRVFMTFPAVAFTWAEEELAFCPSVAGPVNTRSLLVSNGGGRNIHKEKLQ